MRGSASSAVWDARHDEFADMRPQNRSRCNYHLGLIIPPAPPKPNFSASHAKLAKLQSGDQELPQEELQKLKQEIQSEYLSAFQKAVAMHEVFLIRLSHHPVFRGDTNLQLFLEYDKMMAIEAQSMGGSLMGMLSSAKKSLMSDGQLRLPPRNHVPSVDTRRPGGVTRERRTLRQAHTHTACLHFVLILFQNELTYCYNLDGRTHAARAIEQASRRILTPTNSSGSKRTL